MTGMAKKKPSGKHTTKRKPILIPAEWDALAQQLAAEAKMPKMWFVVELIRREAELKGKGDLPPPPWEKPEA